MTVNRKMNQDLAKYLSTSDWHVVDLGWDPEKQGMMESLFTLGNGYVGSRGVLEEIPVGSRPGTFFAGLFDNTGAQVTELINAPNPIALQITVGGEKVGLASMDALDHRRVLDMRHGSLFRETLYQTVVGKRRIRYQSFRFFSMANPHIAALRIAITPLDHAMMLTIPFVLYSIFRYLYLMHQKGETAPPDQVLLKDRPLQVAVALWGVTVLVLLYMA